MSIPSSEPKHLQATVCPLCNQSNASVFFRIAEAPVFCNVLWETPDEAKRADTAAIDLAYCPACGMIYSAGFDDQRVRYAPGYENSLFGSPHYQRYARSSANGLIERYNVRNKSVAEIGCGGGEFLRLLAELGDNRAFGFDPSYRPPGPSATPKVSVVAEAFSPDSHQLPVDLVCCRHVLEHVADPLDFLRGIRTAMGADSRRVLHVEVPNGRFVLSARGLWDVLYEHCSYFVRESLAHLFGQAGFEVLDVSERYDGQFLTIEGRPAPSPSVPSMRDVGGVEESVRSFAVRSESLIRRWRQRLDQAAASGCRQVLWGAGSKGIMFLNVLGVGPETIPYVVDINAKKHGRFVPGTGQDVIAPGQLAAYAPDSVVLMNPVYRTEVAGMLQTVGVSCALVSVWD